MDNMENNTEMNDYIGYNKPKVINIEIMEDIARYLKKYTDNKVLELKNEKDEDIRTLQNRVDALEQYEPPTDVKVPCEGIILNTEVVTIKNLSPVYLTATLIPNTTTDILMWGSNNEKVAVIDNRGVLTPIANGECKIIATCGAQKVECSVVVEMNEISKPSGCVCTKITLDNSRIVVTNLLPIQLKATAEPANEFIPLMWGSTDETVAIVNNNGVVTPISTGSCMIKAACACVGEEANQGYQGNQMATCEVIVRMNGENIPSDPEQEEIKCTKITLSTKNLKFYDAAPKVLVATLEPANTTNVLMWSSSDESIARVDSNGVITPIRDGKCAIVATCVGSGLHPEVCNVTVSMNLEEEPIEPGVTVPCIDVTLTRASLIFTNRTPVVLRATVTPSNTTDVLTWGVVGDDSGIIKLENGVVTPLKNGNCTIMAGCGNITVYCTVVVDFR